MKIFKIITLLMLSVGMLSAAEKVKDSFVIDYIQNALKNNPNVKLIREVKIETKKELKDGWSGYSINLKIDVATKDKTLKTVDAKDRLFTNGTYITRELTEASTGVAMSSMLVKPLGDEYYNKEYLIAGNSGAKNKMVVFSDPLCPFCTQAMPELIKNIKNNPEKIALYYIKFPLVGLHPQAKTVVKASMLAKEKGIKDVDYKVYNAKLNHKLGRTSKDIDALKVVNEVLGTTFTLADINKDEIIQQMEKEIALSKKAGVTGTPFVFWNGVQDKTRSLYKQALKSK